MNEELRTHCVKLLKEYIDDNSKIVEESVFINYGNNINEYCGRIIKILENLKNKDVTENLKNGSWKYNELHNLDKDILNPEKWQKLQDARNPKSIVTEKKKSLYKCPRCKNQYGITFNQVQSRSADEGMTTKLVCQNLEGFEGCGYSWKIN
jgi:DNA-directed RNA polymerase subunit M/transcription elongation factor TFIIS